MMNRQFKIYENQIAEILNYLYLQPYKDVHMLINSLLSTIEEQGLEPTESDVINE